MLPSQASSVHGLLSSQSSLVPAAQVPPLQASPGVQTEPSASQGFPSAAALGAQAPVAGTQVLTAQAPSPLVSHVTIVFGSTLHTNGAAALSQNSVPLQRLSSSLALQSASVWQAQTLLPGLHAPSLQVSPLVHGLPSSQGPTAGLLVQPLALSQPSAVQGLSSLQTTLTSSARPTQAPLPSQRSLLVHALPSSQGLLWGLLLQPVAGAQLSSVQGLLSLQSSASPLQPLSPQTSPPVQPLPSSQGAELGVLLQLALAPSQLSSVHTSPSSQSPSSVMPSQSLSMPSQLSFVAAAAAQVEATPAVAQARVPGQVPSSLLASQLVASCCLAARSLHRHCVALPPASTGWQTLRESPSIETAARQP